MVFAISLQLALTAIVGLAVYMGGISWHPLAAMLMLTYVTAARPTMFTSYVMVVGVIGLALWWTGAHGYGFVLPEWLK